jgi:hypothetical protein
MTSVAILGPCGAWTSKVSDNDIQSSHSHLNCLSWLWRTSTDVMSEVDWALLWSRRGSKSTAGVASLMNKTRKAEVELKLKQHVPQIETKIVEKSRTSTSYCEVKKPMILGEDQSLRFTRRSPYQVRIHICRLALAVLVDCCWLLWMRTQATVDDTATQDQVPILTSHKSEYFKYRRLKVWNTPNLRSRMSHFEIG